MTSQTLQRVIGRLLAERPELWEAFRLDPEGAIREAGIKLTEAEWAELRRMAQAGAGALRPAEHDQARDLGAKLRDELEQARAAQALGRNPLADELSRPAAEEPAPAALAEERQHVESEADRLRAALAEEKKRTEAMKRRMAQALGGEKGKDKSS
jgi:hypothetical protein